jgi:hypothetical protein
MPFDHQAYRAAQAAAEARKTLAARLRAGPVTPELVAEAAAAVDDLHAEIARMRRESAEEQREFQREARSIASEARWDARNEADGVPHGCY